MGGDWDGDVPWAGADAPAPPPPPPEPTWVPTSPPPIASPLPPPPPAPMPAPWQTQAASPYAPAAPPPPPWASMRQAPPPVGRPPALRMLYGTLGLAGIVAVGLVGGSLAHHAARQVHDSERSSTNRATCNAERSVLRAAEEAYFARHPAFGGTYTDEAGLIADGLLARGSSRYDVVLGTPPTTFTIRAVPGGGCT